MPDSTEDSAGREAAAGSVSGVPASFYWLKTTDPQERLPQLPPGVDVRVLLPDDVRYLPLRDKLHAQGAEVRAVKYWLETESITDLPLPGEEPAGPTVRTKPLYATGGERASVVRRDGEAATVARDAFEAMWETQEAQEVPAPGATPADQVVPESWLAYLPHSSLNPAQTQAAPDVLKGQEHLLVVAPTGAGKTTIGMLAALRAVLEEGRKAAWLVPQRSLTDELDRELDGWRAQGLRVERLSGEYSVDARRVREADLWVTTTEKFEVLCRASSMREALAEVGCLIVDEMHLLGDPERGPVLESVLARVRHDESGVRVVGLSATASNADRIAEWLNATLIRIVWRPSRLIRQLPTLPVFSDRGMSQAARTRLTNTITGMVTADHGSVLVFCGSKYSVRSTALAIAASRGAPTGGIRSDDVEALRAVCGAVGVVLHYKDWEYKQDAELSFRSRRADVLVATSTVAAGVNLPARAVIVRDTQIGMRDVDVATVQQMFGRAGRVGAGETTGWAFMLVDAAERSEWQQKLTGGYTVRSQILPALPDHLLAEVVQGRIGTVAEAERWWLHTLSHHQGSHSTEPLLRALNFLAGADYCVLREEEDGGTSVAATALGTLTTRVMVPAAIGFELRRALGLADVPSEPVDAESVLIDQLCRTVPKLLNTPLSEQLRPAVAALLRDGGRVPDPAPQHPPILPFEEPVPPDAPGDLARAALLAVAHSPRAFVRPGREIAGIPYATLRPALDDAPRYLHWLGSQGFLGTVHPWIAVVAADLSRRIRWRRCGPPRGGGRLLWMCEQMATPAHADQVPLMWNAARLRGLSSPDWAARTPPTGNVLDRPAYAQLLRERVEAREIGASDGGVRVRPAPNRHLVTWDGTDYAVRRPRAGEGHAEDADGAAGTQGSGQPSSHGAALFSWRGDYRAVGWLSAYSAAAVSSTAT